jgi:hypothetical protein
MTSKSAS